jgi:GxxExxY protein
LPADTKRQIPLRYRDQDLRAQFCPDIVVQDTVIVELKAVETLARVHSAQVITYLKLASLPIGLLINFNVEMLVKGVRRVVRPDLHRKKR